jgi:hypothetical protein
MKTITIIATVRQAGGPADVTVEAVGGRVKMGVWQTG